MIIMWTDDKEDNTVTLTMKVEMLDVYDSDVNCRIGNPKRHHSVH